MRVVEIIFSPTGGTAKVARLLAQAFDIPITTVDLTDVSLDFAAIPLSAEDLCIIAAPAYGGRIPAAAAQRLAAMKGSGTKAVLVAVYGNRAFDDTLLELQDVSAAAGFVPVAGIGAVAEHSLARQYGAGRPDAADAAQLADFAHQIQAKLDQSPAVLTLPGQRPFKPFGGIPAKPAAHEHCVHCGLCASRCPVGAIDPSAPNQTRSDACISCMRCVMICPQQARSIPPEITAALGQKLSAVCQGRKPVELFL